MARSKNEKTLHMETTKISVFDTCAEIEMLLAKHGATAVMKKFSNGYIEGLQFVYPFEGRDVPIKIPFKWRGVARLAEQGETGYKATAEEEQARRVAARLELRWIQSMFARMDVGLAEFIEIFLPYIMVDDENTFYTQLADKGFAGLIPDKT